MGEEFKAALDVLVDHLGMGLKPERLAAMLLEVYPPQEGEGPEDALGRLQAEFDELCEGLIGAVWLAGDRK